MNRRLQRLRQRVADLRRRLTTLGTALKAVERVLDRLGLSRRPAPSAPPPDLGPSVSSIMRDRHIERNYPAPAPESVRIARPERPPSSTIPPAAGVRREPPAQERPPAAAPAGSREAGLRAQMVEDLIGAVCAGGSRLWRVRSEFERMEATAGVKRLVPKAVDPELLKAVVGPRLGLDVGGAATRAVQPLQAGVPEGLGGRREGLAGAAGALAPAAPRSGPGSSTRRRRRAPRRPERPQRKHQPGPTTTCNRFQRS